VWPRPFLGGVADVLGHRAIRRDAEGRLVALNLDEGRLLWRSAMPLQPLLVAGELALGLALAPPRVLALSLVGASDAPPVWTSAKLPWPDWAATTSDETGFDLELDAARIGDAVALAWQLRRRYTGGAPPGKGRARPAPVSGACAVALSDGRILPALPLPARPADDAPAEAVDDPGVLAEQRLGAATYRLRAVDSGGMLKTVLHALDARQGTPRWECVLDETPRRRPMPPRPGA